MIKGDKMILKIEKSGVAAVYQEEKRKGNFSLDIISLCLFSQAVLIFR